MAIEIRRDDGKKGGKAFTAGYNDRLDGKAMREDLGTEQADYMDGWAKGGERLKKIIPPKRTRAPNGTFDRAAYQREYMRDVKFAKAEGLTVNEWRKKHGKH